MAGKRSDALKIGELRRLRSPPSQPPLSLPPPARQHVASREQARSKAGAALPPLALLFSSQRSAPPAPPRRRPLHCLQIQAPKNGPSLKGAPTPLARRRSPRRQPRQLLLGWCRRSTAGSSNFYAPYRAAEGACVVSRPHSRRRVFAAHANGRDPVEPRGAPRRAGRRVGGTPPRCECVCDSDAVVRGTSPAIGHQSGHFKDDAAARPAGGACLRMSIGSRGPCVMARAASKTRPGLT